MQCLLRRYLDPYIYIGIKNTRRTLTFNLRLCASTFLPCLDRTASLTSESSWHSLECSCFTETSTTHTCIIESRKNQPSMAFDTAQATFTRFYLRHDRRSRGLSMKTHNFRLFKHIQTSFMDHKMDNYVTKGSSKRSVAGSAPSTPFRHRLHRPSQEPSRIKLVLPAPEGPKMAPHVTDIQLPKWVSSNTAHESCVVKGHPETPLEKGRFCSTPLPGRYLFLKNKHTHTHFTHVQITLAPPPKNITHIMEKETNTEPQFQGPIQGYLIHRIHPTYFLELHTEARPPAAVKLIESHSDGQVQHTLR